MNIIIQQLKRLAISLIWKQIKKAWCRRRHVLHQANGINHGILKNAMMCRKCGHVHWSD